MMSQLENRLPDRETRFSYRSLLLESVLNHSTREGWCLHHPRLYKIDEGPSLSRPCGLEYQSRRLDEWTLKLLLDAL